MKRRVPILLCGALVMLVALGSGMAWLKSNPRQITDPDSPEAMRLLLASEVRSVRLAAITLLAAAGDRAGSEALVKVLPGLGPDEFSIMALHLADPESHARLTSATIELLLSSPLMLEGKSNGTLRCLDLVAPGHEKDHLETLKILAGDPRYTARAIQMLLDTGDRGALERAHEVLKRDPPGKNVMTSILRAATLLRLHRDQPLEGYRAIDAEWPNDAGRVRAYYFRELAKQGCHEALIDLWLGTLPGDTPGMARSEAVPPMTEAVTQRNPSARQKLAIEIALAWGDIPEAQRKRLPPAEQDRFLQRNGQYYGRGWVPQAWIKNGVTRESFLRALQEKEGQFIHLIERRRDAGDPDLRELLARHALETTDLFRGRDTLYALFYWLGGVPQEVADRWKPLCQPAPGDSKDDASHKETIRKFITERVPAPKTPKAPRVVAVYSESLTPWRLRHNNTAQALEDLKEIDVAAQKRYVDWSKYPLNLDEMTTPVTYLALRKPDVCAPAGPYRYARMAWAWGYAMASTGPDGLRDISLRHFMLALALENARGQSAPGQGFCLRLGKNGYVFEKQFAPGADLVRYYPDRLYRF